VGISLKLWYVSVRTATNLGVCRICPTKPRPVKLLLLVPNATGTHRSAGSSLSLNVFAFSLAEGWYRFANVSRPCGGWWPDAAARACPTLKFVTGMSRPSHHTPERSG